MKRLLSILCMLPALVAAQAPARSPTLPSSINLQQALQEALDKNLDLLAERYNLSVADARIATARLRPNPVLTFSSDHLDVLGTNYNSFNNAGPNEFAARTDFVLERGGKRANRIAFAEAGKSVALLELQNTARALSFDVESAFIDVLLAKDNLALAQANLGSLQGIVDVNVVRVRTGDLAQVELTRSRVAALQFRTAVQQAQLKLQQAKNRLQLLLGRVNPQPDFGVTGELRSSKGSLPTLETLQQQAYAQRPDLLALQSSQARSQVELRLQLAQGRIDYVVGTEYRRQQGLAGTGNSLGFFFSAPLPVFNRNQGEVARTQREVEQAAARIRALQASVSTEVANAYQQLQTARVQLASLENEMLSQARDVRATTEYSYRRGEASIVEFLDAQRAFNDATQSYNEARAEYARSLFLLESVTGMQINDNPSTMAQTAPVQAVNQ